MARVLLVVYDNESFIHWFPQGIAYIAAVLRQAGHEVVIYNQDVHHYPDAHLTETLDSDHFDVVGVGVIAGYYQYRKLLGLSRGYKRSQKQAVLCPRRAWTLTRTRVFSQKDRRRCSGHR